MFSRYGRPGEHKAIDVFRNWHLEVDVTFGFWYLGWPVGFLSQFRVFYSGEVFPLQILSSPNGSQK